jgi:branched-chain amino acid transport system permease protein
MVLLQVPARIFANSPARHLAVALGLEGLLAHVYNTTYRSIQTGYENFSWTVLGYQVNMVRFFAFLLSLAMLGVLYLILHRTKFGRAVRATVQNPMSAQLLGVNSDMVAALGFGLGAATAAAGGAVFGLISPFNPGSHYDLISRLLTIVVLGDSGIGGSIVAGPGHGDRLGGRRRPCLPIWSDFTFSWWCCSSCFPPPHGLFGVLWAR